MKKLLAIVLALVMVLSLAACDGNLFGSLFSDDSVVKFEELYTHKDPSGLKYDDRKVLINKNFGDTLADTMSAEAYPSNIKMDAEGNIVGIYDYDPETGLASGWTNTMTGEFVAEPADLGKPDESKIVTLAGTVVLGSVVYGNEDKAVSVYIYAFLSDKADKEIVMNGLETYYGLTMTAESDTVLVNVKDESAVDAQFQTWEQSYGQMQSDRSATGYSENLKLDYGFKSYGVNPYAPYSGIVDPEGLQFDEKVILTSSGSYSFADSSLESNMKGRTDVIYGYEGKAVAHYIYYEYNDKAGADKLMGTENFFGKAERISDTVVGDQLTGQDFQDVVQAYIGYNVMKDDSLESYVDNAEGSFFLMRYEG